MLLDLEFSEIGGPLAQFQAKKFDKDGVKEVIRSINQTAPLAVPDARSEQLFEALWPQFEKLLGSIPKQPTPTKPIRQAPEVLEELVSGVRSLESRFKTLQESISNIDADHPGRSGRAGRVLNPMMLRDLSMWLRDGVPGEPIALLLIASMMREDLPWLYELGMEAYRLLKRGRTLEARHAVQVFQRVYELTLRAPFSDSLVSDPAAMYTLAHELDYLITRDIEYSTMRTGEDDAGKPSDSNKG